MSSFKYQISAVIFLVYIHVYITLINYLYNNGAKGKNVCALFHCCTVVTNKMKCHKIMEQPLKIAQNRLCTDLPL